MLYKFALLIIVGSSVLIPVNAVAQEAPCYQCVTIITCWSCFTGFYEGGTGCSTVSCNSCTVTGSCWASEGGCFLGNVNVATPSGMVEICKLNVGDIVYSTNDSGHNQLASVTNTHISEAWGYLTINNNIEVTGNHLFYANGIWTEANKLSIGDKLVNQSGDIVLITSINNINIGVRVYNISVDGANTYYANGILVHNKPPTPSG